LQSAKDEMTDVHNFGVDAISCHAWNKDKTGIKEKRVYYLLSQQRDVFHGSSDSSISLLFFFYTEVTLV